MSSLLASEYLVENFSFPSEGRAEDQTSLVKVKFGGPPSFSFDRKLSAKF